MEYVIGCDIGSQSLKAILLSQDGQLAGEASISYPIDYPQPTWAEQSAEQWLDAFIQAIRLLLDHHTLQPGQVRGISLAAQVDGVVATDASGLPLYPAIIWMDRRAVEQCAQVAEHTEPGRLFDLSGLNLDPSHVALKIRWLRDHQPEVYRQAQHFLLPGSYLAYQLTGELGVDYSNASSTLLMDVRRKEWSAELCELFEIDPNRLAPVLPSTQILGTLRQEIAAETGLLAGTPVVLGSGDEHAACLGAGVILPGLVCDIAGTAEPVCAASSAPSSIPPGWLRPIATPTRTCGLLKTPDLPPAPIIAGSETSSPPPRARKPLQLAPTRMICSMTLPQPCPPAPRGWSCCRA